MCFSECIQFCIHCILIYGGSLTQITQLFVRAIEMEPEVGHSKYMYMGQITVGRESEKYFLAGIELMKQSLASLTSRQVINIAQLLFLILYCT